MSETSPFEAAIECLGWHLTDMKACVSHSVGREGGCPSHAKEIKVVESAIRLLEAAGKIDRGATIKDLDGYWVYLSHRGFTETNPNIVLLMELLKSLPDKEKT